MIYLFLGGDTPEKDAQLRKAVSASLARGSEEFNLDTLYGDDLSLSALQERLKSLPVNSPARVIIIKSAHRLHTELKDYLLDYVRKPFGQITLILEADPKDGRDAFITGIAHQARVVRQPKNSTGDVFMLCRYVDQRQAVLALKLLVDLLQAGERPERLLGGMRYCWCTARGQAAQGGQRMERLLECDREIKTGKLKPNRALEKLVIELASF